MRVDRVRASQAVTRQQRKHSSPCASPKPLTQAVKSAPCVARSYLELEPEAAHHEANDHALDEARGRERRVAAEQLALAGQHAREHGRKAPRVALAVWHDCAAACCAPARSLACPYLCGFPAVVVHAAAGQLCACKRCETRAGKRRAHVFCLLDLVKSHESAHMVECA